MTRISARRTLPFLLVAICLQGEYSVAVGQQTPAPPQDPFSAPPHPSPDGEAPLPSPTAAKSAPAARRRVETRRIARERIEQELERATDLDVVEMPLKDVLIYVQEKHRIPVVIATKKLEEASIAPDSAVTTNLSNLTLASALDLMLKDLELDYYLGEVLVVTTPYDAASQAEIRTYDCRGLLQVAGRNPAEQADRAARLVQTIQSTVAADTWRGSSGSLDALDAHTGRRTMQRLPTVGVIVEFDGILVVTQTAKAHRKIQQVLNMLGDAAEIPPILGKVVQ